MSSALLRKYITYVNDELNKVVVSEQKFGPGKDYQRKEVIRQRLQDFVSTMVETNEITDQKSLEDVFKTFNIAIESLKHVPFNVWQQMLAVKTKRS